MKQRVLRKASRSLPGQAARYYPVYTQILRNSSWATHTPEELRLSQEPELKSAQPEMSAVHFHRTSWEQEAGILKTPGCSIWGTITCFQLFPASQGRQSSTQRMDKSKAAAKWAQGTRSNPKYSREKELYQCSSPDFGPRLELHEDATIRYRRLCSIFVISHEPIMTSKQLFIVVVLMH